MEHALGSNRAEYSRKNDLALKIRLTRHMLGKPAITLKDCNLEELKRIWHETYEEGVSAGIIKRPESCGERKE